MGIAYAVSVSAVQQRVAVEDQHGVVVVEHVERNLTVLLWTEYALIAGREMLQAHSRCEGGIAAIVQVQWLGDSDGHGGQSFHLLIVPVVGLQTATSVVGK